MIKQYLKYYKSLLRIGTWTNHRNETEPMLQPRGQSHVLVVRFLTFARKVSGKSGGDSLRALQVTTTASSTSTPFIVWSKIAHADNPTYRSLLTLENSNLAGRACLF